MNKTNQIYDCIQMLRSKICSTNLVKLRSVDNLIFKHQSYLLLNIKSYLYLFVGVYKHMNREIQANILTGLEPRCRIHGLLHFSAFVETRRTQCIHSATNTAMQVKYSIQYNFINSLHAFQNRLVFTISNSKFIHI